MEQIFILFPLIFMQQLDKPFIHFAVLVDILPLDPHIFADPDPGSQNVADQMDFSTKINKTMLIE